VSSEEWELFVSLYRQVWRAHADLATLRTMLRTSELAAAKDRSDVAVAAIKGWEARLEKSRGANFYVKYLANCESHIVQAQQQRSAAMLIQLISLNPPPDFPTKTSSN